LALNRLIVAQTRSWQTIALRNAEEARFGALFTAVAVIEDLGMFS
jgi:hypothetical protein